MTTEQHKTLMSHAVDAWYRRGYPLDPKYRAYALAEEYGLDGEAVYEACRADFAPRAEHAA